MATLFIFVSCVLATALATSGGATYSIGGGPVTGQGGAPTGVYGQQPLQQAGAVPGAVPAPYGGQYQQQTKFPDGSVKGQYGYQTDGTSVQVTYNTATNPKPVETNQPQPIVYTETTKTDLSPETKTETDTTSKVATAGSVTTTTTTTAAKDKTQLTSDTPTTYVIGQGQPGHTIYKLPVSGIYPAQSPSFGQGNPGFYYTAANTFATNPNQVAPVDPNKFLAISPVAPAPFPNPLPQAQHFTYTFSAPNAAPIPSNVYGFNAPFGFWNGRLPLPYSTTYSTFQQPAPFRQQQQHYFYGTAPGLINQFPSNQFPSSQFGSGQYSGQQFSATNPFPNRYYNLYYPQGNLHRYPTAISA
jgi:hypothetical protein